MLSRYKRLLERIGTVERGLGIALILYIVGAIAVQVFTRYALGRPIAWVEESATYAFIWMSFVGASVGLNAGTTHPRLRHSVRICRPELPQACARSSGRWCY